jgi:hypothetical protein
MARTAEKQQTKAKVKVALVPSEVINTIRSHRAGNLQIMNMEYMDVLLASYDEARAELRVETALLQEANVLLTGKQTALDIVNFELSSRTDEVLALTAELEAIRKIINPELTTGNTSAADAVAPI